MPIFPPSPAVLDELRMYCQFRVAYKQDSWGLRALGWLMKPFNPAFMTDYTTVLGNTVWFPSQEVYDRRGGITMAHEFVHLWDKADSPLWFTLSYLSPQILVIPGLAAAATCLALGLGWWAIVALLLAVLVTLLPSPWRVFWELRGYTMTLAYHYWVTGKHLPILPIEEQFTGWAYWHMANDPTVIREKLLQAQQDITSGEVQKRGPYRAVHTALRNAGLLHG